MSDRATGFREIDAMENKIQPQRPNMDYFKLKKENEELRGMLEVFAYRCNCINYEIKNNARKLLKDKEE